MIRKNNLVETVVLSPYIRNIVATLNIGNKLDLNCLTQNLINSHYEPEQFSALISHVFLNFSSGKIVIIGAKTEEKTNWLCSKYLWIVKEFTVH